jgi:enamine deaminase RidA (YjgF/YER057c/UK114 family)
MPHPRLWGAFPRVLGHYCRDERLFPLTTAIHKMTGLSAARFQLADRGLVKVGYFADLVLFDPQTVRDVASFSDPKRPADGIEAVMVNGVMSYGSDNEKDEYKRYGGRYRYRRAAPAVARLVSGQTPMKDGEVVEGGIVDQSRLAIQNCVDIMTEAGYTLADVVHVKVILTDARYFQSFNKVFREFFGDNPPARICCVADLVVDCKVEVDVTCYNASRIKS